MAYRKPQRREVNPRNIRKHSQIVAQDQAATGVVGKREKTDTGYIVKGVECGAFETYTEVYMPHSASNTFKHPKKHRVYRVVSGSGIMALNDTVQNLFAGVTVHIEPDTAFRVVTTGEAALEFIVTQSPKYDSRITTLDDQGVGSNSLAVLNSLTAEEAQNSGIAPRRRGSKAKEQAAMLPSQRKKAVTGNQESPPQSSSPINVAPAKVVDGELVA